MGTPDKAESGGANGADPKDPIVAAHTIIVGPQAVRLHHDATKESNEELRGKRQRQFEQEDDGGYT